MELKVINEQGQASSTLSVSDALFGRDYNEALIHQVVVAYQANARSANRAQKGRSEVAKSTRKPWRQKGTGRARAGMASSPLWRGGGRIFPNSPEENFSHKVNRKMYRAGVAAIYSQLVREGRLQVVDSFMVDSPKTKQFAAKLKSMGLDHVMIIADAVDENLYLSSRNLPHVYVVEPSQVDPVSLVHFRNVVVTRGAVKQIEEMYA
ncbi:50S ribosomal protein L4 [Chitinivorax sp. B]|uniref:50S ribosomal protein L4 n=1 Tax=Chitinivorax sp. B TaxID=2502235 RepID=UPI0010FA2CE8|nr:50S ribosomal protein L4 [Chitinivorax sp. B]